MSGIGVRDSCQPTFYVKERTIEEFLSIIAVFANVVRDRLRPIAL
jgi:hypothetical protein